MQFQDCYKPKIKCIINAKELSFIDSSLFQNMYKYRKSTSIRHFEQCNQQLSNLICQNCDGSIKMLLDVGNQQHAVYYNLFIQIINFHGLFP